MSLVVWELLVLKCNKSEQIILWMSNQTIVTNDLKLAEFNFIGTIIDITFSTLVPEVIDYFF